MITARGRLCFESRADKLRLVMRGKVTLLRKYCRSPRRELGIRLLLGAVALRALARPGLRDWQTCEPGASREFWVHRRDRLGGYDPVHDVLDRARARTYARA